MKGAVRYRIEGSDNWQGTRPRTDAERLRTYGRILPMDRPEDQPPMWLGMTMLFAGLIFIIVTVLLVGAVTQKPPAAPAEASASRGIPSHASSLSAHGQPGAGR
jgi:hypothetical protein